MKPEVKLLSLVLASVTLTACGHSDIGKVKDAKVLGNSTYTNGQALGGRAVCDSVDWSTSKDDHDRPIVAYQCELKNGVQTIRGEASKYQLSLKNEYDRLVSGYDQQIDERAKELGHDQDLAAKISDPSVTDLQFAEAFGLGTDWAPADLSAKRQEMKSLYETTVRVDKSRVNDLKSIRSQYVDTWAQQRDAGLKLTEALGHTKSVIETYQWAIDPDGNPVILSGSIQVLDGGGKTISSWIYPAPNSYIADSISSKAATFQEYVSDTVVGALVAAH